MVNFIQIAHQLSHEKKKSSCSPWSLSVVELRRLQENEVWMHGRSSEFSIPPGRSLQGTWPLAVGSCFLADRSRWEDLNDAVNDVVVAGGVVEVA